MIDGYLYTADGGTDPSVLYIGAVIAAPSRTQAEELSFEIEENFGITLTFSKVIENRFSTPFALLLGRNPIEAELSRLSRELQSFAAHIDNLVEQYVEHDFDAEAKAFKRGEATT